MQPLKKTSPDYSVSVIIRSTSESAFRALTREISNWWGEMDCPVDAEGNIFTVSWGEPWYQFRVMEYMPNTKISWECIDSKQIIGDLKGVEKEWVGTTLHWAIAILNPEEIKLSLRHEGLVPDFVCYYFCSSTWDNFVNIQLKKYLES